MASMFDVSEVVQVAVNDEKTGVAFYTALAAKAKDPALRAAFAGLANQERFHQKRFEVMLKDLGDYKPPEQYSDEYVTYVNALTGDRAFPDEAGAVKAANKCRTDLDALQVALEMERDTLVLMHELRKMVGDKDRILVDELIREEQQHVADLAAAKKRLAGK